MLSTKVVRGGFRLREMHAHFLFWLHSAECRCFFVSVVQYFGEICSRVVSEKLRGYLRGHLPVG